jgi:hypothetical protein
MARLRLARKHSKCQFRPRIERLEDRNLLSAVFAVTNTNDAGPGSLRQAILDAGAASDAAEIRFQIAPDAPNVFEDVDAGLPGGDAAPDVFVIRPQSPLPAIKPNQGTRPDPICFSFVSGSSVVAEQKATAVKLALAVGSQ